MRAERAKLVGWVLLGVTLLVPAYLLINTTFMPYDDEGYMLSTLRAFISGHRLYDEVFSQYGPVPYLYHQVIVAITRQPLTHMLGREITAVHWALTGVLTGLLAARLSGRFVTGVFAGIVTFALLWQMCSEPSHPGSFVAFVIAAVGLLTTILPATKRPIIVAGLLGAMAALLLLTKINVGLLLAAGLGCVALRFTACSNTWRPWACCIAATGILLVPWALMARRLADAPVLIFAIQFTLSAAGLLWISPANRNNESVPPRVWGSAVLGFVGTGLGVCVALMLQGTSLHTLLDAVLFDPLRHPANFLVSFSWIPAVWPVTLVSGVLVAHAGLELRRHGKLSPLTRNLVVSARLSAFAFFLFHASTWPTIIGVGRFISVCLPLLPLFVVRLESKTDQTSTGLLWVAFVALPQVLHAYPIAGSQMGWGSLLCVPLLVVGLDRAVRQLPAMVPVRRMAWMAPLWATVCLAVGGWEWWLLANEGWQRYRTSRPLDLPGAEDIRVTGAPRESLRLLTLNAVIHADVLFSRPGMFSYNIWSGVPTPTRRNATHWFWLLSASEQSAIIDRLQSTPRRAIITNRLMEEFLVDHHIPMTGPLQTHLSSGYRVLFAFDDFSFLVPVESRAAAFGKIRLLGATTPDAGNLLPVMLQTNLLLDGQPVSVALEQLNPPWNRTLDLCPPGAQAWLEPIDRNGQPLGPALKFPATAPVEGLFRLTLFCDGPPRISSPKEIALFVRDPDNRIVAEAVF